ncbi:MAG: branched-chain amino acid aminotransferase [Acidobacteriota bacterium]
MQIRISDAPLTPPEEIARRKQNPGFGKVFSDRMFVARWTEERGWHDLAIEPYAPIPLDPAANVLHYAQEVFEGLKAYGWQDGRVALFRPEMNGRRLNQSAERMCMPTVPEPMWRDAIETLVDLERAWVPTDGEGSLYIRPTMIGTEPSLGVKVSNSFLFYVIVGPAGPYFPTGFKPVRIWVTREFVRAAVGGIGFAKTAGNYAASLLPGRIAAEKGCSQVLYLDARERRYIEELGGMNVFCRFGGRLVTPPLTGSILPGVTRDSILRLAPDLGYEVEERPIAIDEIVDGARSGELGEMFAVGTAAVVTAIGELVVEDEPVRIGDGGVGETATQLYRKLTDIQYGRGPDPYGWTRIVEPRG